jgi:predicted RNase H-like nuclease (RuvC/YqgF family)
MADIYTFTPKTISNQSVEIDRLRAKLMELYEARDALNKEIRYTKDAITLLEKGEK